MLTSNTFTIWMFIRTFYRRKKCLLLTEIAAYHAFLYIAQYKILTSRLNWTYKELVLLKRSENQPVERRNLNERQALAWISLHVDVKIYIPFWQKLVNQIYTTCHHLNISRSRTKFPFQILMKDRFSEKIKKYFL